MLRKHRRKVCTDVHNKMLPRAANQAHLPQRQHLQRLQRELLHG